MEVKVTVGWHRVEVVMRIKTAQPTQIVEVDPETEVEGMNEGEEE